jgi:nucleoside phosphorylase
MAQIPSNIAEAKGRVDFGVISIREDEYDAVLKRLTVEQLLVGRQRYAMSRLKTVSDDEYVVAAVRSLEPGTGQAQDVARTMIDELDPQWILLVGIAGSIPDYEYTLGDVILASRLHDFGVSAMIEGDDGKTRQEFASGGGPMHPDVQSLIANLPALNLFLDEWFLPSALSAPRPVVRFGADNFYGNEAWQKKVKDCLRSYFGKRSKRDYPKALAASVASSGILLKDTQTAAVWLTTSRDIKGIEMELAGVYQAAWGYHKPVLAIRGISDVVGLRRSPEWTNYACHTAAAFTLALLQSRPIVPLESKEGSQPVPSTLHLTNQQIGIFKEKPPNPVPLAKQETLYSNLLEVADLPNGLFAVQTDCKDVKAVWAILNKETVDPPNDWIIKARTLYAFHDFSNPIWNRICDASTAEEHQTSHWSNSHDLNRRNEFIELLMNCLKEFGKSKDLKYINKAWVKREKKKFRFMCYEPTSDYADPPLFRGKDFIDADTLVTTLKGKQTPLAEHLFSRLPDDTQDLIKRYPASADSKLRTALVDGFNEILKAALYDKHLFEDVFIRREAYQLLEADSLDEQGLMALNRMLLEDAYWKIIAKRMLVPRRIVITSLTREAPTWVFKGYRTRSGQLSYYRHQAFRPHFTRIDGKWYLEITPTYHYTSNGYRVSPFYEDAINGIKRIERSGAVFRQVMFWARVLQDNKGSLLDQRVYPYLRFGRLLEFKIDYGIRDDVWGKNIETPENVSSNRLFTA